MKRFPRRRIAIIAIVILTPFILWKGWKFLTAERTYYPGGQLQSYGEIDYFKRNFDGQAASSGVSKFYYQDGKRKSVAYFKAGKKNGRRIVWSPAGMVMDDWTFSMNRPADGKRIIKFEDGKIAEEFNYTNGVLNGRYAKWATNGRLVDEWYFVNGNPIDGQRTTWFENGDVVSTENYLNGNLNGWLSVFKKNRKVAWRTFYVDGSSTVSVHFDAESNTKQISTIEKSGDTTIENFGNGRRVQVLHIKR